MGDMNSIGLKETPKALAGTIKTQACNAAHLVELLQGSPYPPTKQGCIAGR
jgi:hypothetical protein